MPYFTLFLPPIFGAILLRKFLAPFLDYIILTYVFKRHFWTPFQIQILAVWRVLFSNHPIICTQNIQTIMPI